MDGHHIFVERCFRKHGIKGVADLSVYMRLHISLKDCKNIPVYFYAIHSSYMGRRGHECTAYLLNDQEVLQLRIHPPDEFSIKSTRKFGFHTWEAELESKMNDPFEAALACAVFRDTLGRNQ